MKNMTKMETQMRRIISALILLALVSTSAFAQKIKSMSSKTYKGKPLTELAKERRTKPLADHTGEEHQLLFLEREILRLYEIGDFEKGLSYLTEDAMVNPPGMEAVFGRENQKKMFAELLALDGVQLTWEPIEAYVGKGAQMGYVYGLVKWKMPNEEEKLGKYISIYIKENGKWMNQVEIRNLIK